MNYRPFQLGFCWPFFQWRHQTCCGQDLEAAHRDQLSSASEQLETQRQVVGTSGRWGMAGDGTKMFIGANG